MKKYDVLFPSENAYRVAATLLACAEESGEVEALIPDIAHKANIHYSVARYWVNIFDICGFIRTTRYENRENANCMDNRHVIVHLTAKKKLAKLYSYMWMQRWENNFIEQLSVEPRLSIVEKAA